MKEEEKKKKKNIKTSPTSKYIYERRKWFLIVILPDLP
jgi:hypothetical protein